MKAGFFFQNSVNIGLLQTIADENSLELVGAFFQSNDESNSSDPKIYESEDELLVQIEVAYIFYNGDNYFDFAAKALKRGVNIFLASLPDYSHSSLVEINELSTEIGVPIGFGCAGEILVKQDEIIGNCFMLELTRDTGKATSDEVFRRMLIYDIASFVRIKPYGMRKLRVNGLPLFNQKPTVINLRFEYDNSSIIASSIARVDEDEKCVLRFFSGDDGYFKDLSINSIAFESKILESPQLILSDEGFIANLGIYSQEIISKSPLSFGIENAIETFNLFETIEERLNPFS
ncbi:MAG: hypothetical protein EHM93_18510 [Bacteroidales bacterium]|nr:MAG: hypothetical protein EHM93_18510 [Bacteroidales bacterium]